MSISVVIPTYGERPEYLLDTLRSVCAQDRVATYEVLVVDNSPTQRATAVVEAFVSGSACSVRVVHEPRVGLHYARHTGARCAQGDIIVYVDDDVLAPPGWLAAISAVFDDADVSCAGGPAVAKWEAEVPAWLGQFEGGYLSLLDMGPARRELKYPECVWGCNMAVRRAALFEVGGFNPDGIGDRRSIWLRGDGECGLQEKLTDARMRIVYEPAAWLHHRIPSSRLTPAYFRWRFFTQGIQESFVRIRRASSPAVAMLLVVPYTGYCLLQMVRFYARSLLVADSREIARALAWMYYGRAGHQLRVLLSPALRRHVLRQTFFDETDVPPSAAPFVRTRLPGLMKG